MAPLNTPKTVLQRINDELVERVMTLRDEYNDARPLFNIVASADISTLDAVSLPACGITQSAEEVEADATYVIDKATNFLFEFRWVREEGVDPFDQFRYYLGRLQALLFGIDDASLTVGGLVNSINEDTSNPQIEGIDDNLPSGVLVATVRYRHPKGDPYRLMSEI